MTKLLELHHTKHHYLIKHSVNMSLFVQIITAIIDLYVLQISVPESYYILKQLLLVEFIVQFVEGSFYVWLASSFNTVENITPYRYYDWYLTTPTMLLSFSIYLIYLKNQEENKNETKNKKTNSDKKVDIFLVMKKNATTFTYIFLLNALMLTFGLLGELNIINKYASVFCGFIPFLILFSLIYNNYAKYSTNGTTLFAYFFIIWSFYGIAALLPYHLKNICYNILDLFAKNFFGLYLAYILWNVAH